MSACPPGVPSQSIRWSRGAAGARVCQARRLSVGRGPLRNCVNPGIGCVELWEGMNGCRARAEKDDIFFYLLIETR